MPSLKHIRTRIGSVKNTQQITKAMKMVAASRLRHAQDRLGRARPYSGSVRRMISQIAAHAGEEAHPLLAQRPAKRAQVIVLTSDRGLCGGFNSNVIKAASRYIDNTQVDESLQEVRDQHEHIELALIGKKGTSFFNRQDVEIRQEHLDVLTQPSLERANDIGSTVVADFIDGNLDAVFVVYNEFKSAIQQNVRVEQLLPIVPAPIEEGDTQAGEFKYEPTKNEILDALLPMFVNVEIYRHILESIASEMGARMTAMESATKNATDLIQSLTLQYNRARQAAITTELMEITGGAEALKQS